LGSEKEIPLPQGGNLERENPSGAGCTTGGTQGINAGTPHRSTARKKKGEKMKKSRDDTM